MPYTINFSDTINKQAITVEDGSVPNQETSLQFPGKNSNNYGQVIGENFLHLLENFAKNSAPQRPIEGQLWYDITPGINQLKVYDGTNWVSSGGLKKGGNQPGSAESTAGDLWVDTGNQQLYLFTGSGWILVGPEFSTGLSSGTKPESIAGTDDVTHSIVKIQVAGKVIAIIASESFTPKSNIAGFSTLQPGVNLSLTDVEGDGIPKMYGTAEKADALVVGNQTIAANNFLRSDTTSSSDFGLKIKNNAGVEVGLSGTLKLSVEGQAGVLSHQTAGSNIDFKVNDSGVSRTVMRIDATQKVGINTTAPTEALEVLGNLKTTGLDSSNGKVIVDNSTDSTSVGTGAITTIGGVGISKSLTVGENVNVGGNLSVDAIIPNDNLTHDIGSTNKKFLNVYGNQFYGSFNGNVSGSLNGVATQANQLTSATTFQMTGDVSATGFTFDGTGDLVKSFTTSISNAFISNKQSTGTSQNTDEVLINRTEGTTGLFRTTVQNILSTVPTPPVGSVIAFAGANAPTGWLLCDGQEVNRSTYATLYGIIGLQYGTPSSTAVFKLPDLRGRQVTGKDNMGGTSANVVADTVADALGGFGGSEEKTIAKEQLPDHEHDLRADNQDQFYVIRNIADAPTDPEVIQFNGPTGINTAQALASSGSVAGTKGQPFNVMDPFLTLNYIIYAGATS